MEQSLDPVVRRIADKYRELTRETSSLWSFLTNYVAQAKPAEPPRPAISPQEHYDLLDQADCGCSTCVDWSTRREEFKQALKFVPPEHKWTTCNCDDCRFVGRFHLNFLAAANRRELLIEMSFHARYHSRHGALVMAWLDQEMQNPAYTVNWLAQEMNRFPMERWLKRCEIALSARVSGQVFVTSTMMTELTVSYGSSLLAAVSMGDLG